MLIQYAHRHSYVQSLHTHIMQLVIYTIMHLPYVCILCVLCIWSTNIPCIRVNGIDAVFTSHCDIYIMYQVSWYSLKYANSHTYVRSLHTLTHYLLVYLYYYHFHISCNYTLEGKTCPENILFWWTKRKILLSKENRKGTHEQNIPARDKVTRQTLHHPNQTANDEI